MEVKVGGRYFCNGCKAKLGKWGMNPEKSFARCDLCNYNLCTKCAQTAFYTRCSTNLFEQKEGQLPGEEEDIPEEKLRQIEEARNAYPIKDKDELEKYLTLNKFDNMGNGVNIDGQIDFRSNRSFTLWDA